MTNNVRSEQLALLPPAFWPPKTSENKPNLHTYWQHPEELPPWLRECPTIMRGLNLLGPLNWRAFPERNLERNWGQPTIPYAAVAAVELLRLNDGVCSTEKLCRYLREHPGFIWLCGFPLYPAPNSPLGFNAPASLPTPRYLTDLFRALPNMVLQFLLADSVRLILGVH